MKPLWMLLFLLFPILSEAWTLNNNFGGAFKSKRVKVYVDDLSSCSNAQVSAYEWEGLIKPAIDNFWNRIPTSSLRLVYGGAISGPPNISNGRLCAPTDNECITSGGPIIGPAEGILIACNSLAANFNNAGNVLAVTVPNNFSGRRINGAVILINDLAGSNFAELSRSDRISVIAHEIGHAIGLGHAEEKNKEALMYYRTVNLRKSLGQDDIDGVSFLYPVKVDGCGLFTGTIDTGNKKGPPFLSMLMGLFLMIAFFEFFKRLRSLLNPETRPAT
jgi:hypothetical protein